jgi:hypothetical protein
VINAGLAHPKVKAGLADLGAATLPGSPDDFGNLIHRGNRKVEEVVRVANIKAEQTANPCTYKRRAGGQRSLAVENDALR